MLSFDDVIMLYMLRVSSSQRKVREILDQAEVEEKSNFNVNEGNSNLNKIQRSFIGYKI